MNTTFRHRTRIGLVAGVAAIALAACGTSTTDTPAPAAAPAPAAEPVTTPAPVAEPAPVEEAAEAPAEAEPAGSPVSGPAAKSANTALGPVLTDTNGLTLYGFTNDFAATSACYGTCADAWPPIIVSSDFAVGPGLDVGIFATTERDDGQLQLVAGRFPLYTFAADAVPGDITGHGSGDVWFAINIDGTLYPADAPLSEVEAAEPAAIVSTGTTDLGDILVDADGLSLYGFTDDVDGNPTCDGACADAWPPIIVDSETLPEGLDASIFSVVTRTDGSFQLKAGKWPLYLFAGDGSPGDVNGQGSGDVWFLAAPDGALVGA